jgi:hypothetical protein
MATVQTTAGGMPVLILKEGTKENKGREAQRNNITAAKQVAAACLLFRTRILLKKEEGCIPTQLSIPTTV